MLSLKQTVILRQRVLVDADTEIETDCDSEIGST